MVGAARTQPPLPQIMTPHSPTWGDGKPVLLPSAMEATNLSHGPSWSPIDPVQVSMFFLTSDPLIYIIALTFLFLSISNVGHFTPSTQVLRSCLLRKKKSPLPRLSKLQTNITSQLHHQKPLMVKKVMHCRCDVHGRAVPMVSLRVLLDPFS